MRLAVAAALSSLLGSALVPGRAIAESIAPEMLLQQSTLVISQQSNSYSFTTPGPGTLMVQLGDVDWPTLLQSVNLSVDSPNQVLGSLAVTGGLDLTLAHGGTYYADVTGQASGPLDIGVYSLQVEYLPPGVVPLPPTLILLGGGLALLAFAVRARGAASQRPTTAGGRTRVLFVNQYYAPDISATSQMLTDLAEGLVRAGIEVGVICSRQLYQDAHARLAAHEVIRGVHVWRVRTACFGRDRLGGRALDCATFYLGAAAAICRRSRQFDVLVLKTDPPLLSLIGWLLPKPRHVVRINWLQDIFPEIATRLTVSPLTRLLESALRRLRDRSLSTADGNVVLGSRMREFLIARGVPAARITVGENWADEETVKPCPAAQSALRRQLGLSDRFVVSYAGNLGRAHELDTLVNAARLLRDDPDIVFLMIGGGVKMRALQAQADEHVLTQMRFLPHQPRVALGDMLAAADVHLVTLLPQLEGLLVPSKFYGILAAGRSVVFVGDSDGELARLIREFAVGLTVTCGDGAALRGALERLRADPAECAAMGARARALFEQRFTQRIALARWRALLTQTVVVAPRSAEHRIGHGPVALELGGEHAQ